MRTSSKPTRRSIAASNVAAGIEITHADKLFYPSEGITKLEIARYYERVAKWMLPHAANRLLCLRWCPDGIGGRCSFERHPPKSTPNHFRAFQVIAPSSTKEFLALYDVQGLVALVQGGVLEIHVRGSRADQWQKPDRLVFDLDPGPDVVWQHVIDAAKQLRWLLAELGLASFVKTTGGKGLHIVAPIRRRLGWPEVKAFCRKAALFMQAAAPQHYTATMSKAARPGKIFVVYFRNDHAATAIAPYSTRARPGATVSVPIDWEELSDKLTSDYFNIRNVDRRLAKLKNDPWHAMLTVDQGITAAMMRKIKLG